MYLEAAVDVVTIDYSLDFQEMPPFAMQNTKHDLNLRSRLHLTQSELLYLAGTEELSVSAKDTKPTETVPKMFRGTCYTQV